MFPDLDSDPFGPEPTELVDLPAERERLAAITHTGRDREHLVTVQIDGEGLITRVRLAPAATTRDPRVVEQAVVNAAAAAQAQLDQAWHELAVRVDPSLARGAEEPPEGGIEMAVDPAASPETEAGRG